MTSTSSKPLPVKQKTTTSKRVKRKPLTLPVIASLMVGTGAIGAVAATVVSTAVHRRIAGDQLDEQRAARIEAAALAKCQLEATQKAFEESRGKSKTEHDRLVVEIDALKAKSERDALAFETSHALDKQQLRNLMQEIELNAIALKEGEAKRAAATTAVQRVDQEIQELRAAIRDELGTARYFTRNALEHDAKGQSEAARVCRQKAQQFNESATRKEQRINQLILLRTELEAMTGTTLISIVK